MIIWAIKMSEETPPAAKGSCAWMGFLCAKKGFSGGNKNANTAYG